MSHSTSITPEDIIDKTVLIGLTRITPDGQVLQQQQFPGKVISVEEDSVHVRLPNGEPFTLPPDLSAFHLASPGVYRLRSTGEEIVNPDFTCTWDIQVQLPENSS